MDDRVTRTRLDPDTPERFVSLRRQLGVTTFGFNQLVLQAGQQGRIHRHQRQEEVYLVLEGTLSVAFADEEVDLGPGELLRVPCDVRRRLLNRGPERVVLLALGGADEHRGRDGEAFADWSSVEPLPPQELTLPDDLPPAERR
jgi:mannose-6-phosphate isomerase-like protein (cupin superfamily)